jgi:hypothetical protein
MASIANPLADITWYRPHKGGQAVTSFQIQIRDKGVPVPRTRNCTSSALSSTMINSLIGSWFQAKPAALSIPIAFISFFRWRSLPVPVIMVALFPLISVEHGFHCLCFYPYADK